MCRYMVFLCIWMSEAEKEAAIAKADAAKKEADQAHSERKSALEGAEAVKRLGGRDRPKRSSKRHRCNTCKRSY